MNDELINILSELDQEIKWYDTKAVYYKKINSILSICEILISASLPFISSLSMYVRSVNLVIGFMGLILSVICSIKLLKKYNEKWLDYRKITEVLKNEKKLFAYKVTPYDGANAIPLFIKFCATAQSKELSVFLHNNKANVSKP